MQGSTVAIDRDGCRRGQAITKWLWNHGRRRAEPICRALADSMVAGVFRCDAGWRLTGVNPAVERIIGRPTDRLLGLGWIDTIRPDQQPRIRRIVADHARRPLAVAERTLCFIQPDGGEHWATIGLTPLRDNAGTIEGYAGVMLDVTRHEAARAALRASEARFAALAELSPAVIFRTDPAGRFSFVNRSWKALTGRDAAAARGFGWTETIHPEDRGALLDGWAAMTAAGAATTREYRLLHVDGSTRWTTVSLAPETAADGSVGFVGVITDITAQKIIEFELTAARTVAELAATTDELTGLANRREFMGRLRGEVTRCRLAGAPLTLAIVDIDDFKWINDHHGHPRGDVVLRDVAHILRSSVRSADLVGRIGGEEFAVSMPGTGAGVAHATCERLRAAIAAHDFGLGRLTAPVTVSAGVAELAAGEAAADLIERTDRALYAAKHHGRDRVESAA